MKQFFQVFGAAIIIIIIFFGTVYWASDLGMKSMDKEIRMKNQRYQDSLQTEILKLQLDSLRK